MLKYIDQKFREHSAVEQLGDNCLLITGDALTWISRIHGAHAFITDPPYCSGGTTTAARKQRPTQKYSSDRVKDFPDFDGECRDQRAHQIFTERWMNAALCSARPAAHLFVFSDFRQIPLTSDALQLAGWRWDGMAVWDKINGRPKPNGIRQQAEYILHGTRNIYAKPEPGSVYIPGVIRESLVPQSNRQHLTQKPVSVMQQFVNAVPVGGLIVDPFGGSGSTAVTSLNSGRRVILIESVLPIASIARSRIITESLNSSH